MQKIDNIRPKTLGPRSAVLLARLHERGRLVFTLADVTDITGLRGISVRTFMHKLVGRGVATRLRSGLFVLVPFDVGQEREYMGNPYVVARELMGGKPYYVSHASAMDLHGMTTQPRLVIFVTSPEPPRGRTILGTEFRFVRCQARDFFGTTGHWIDRREQVVASDLERTILDGLKQPEHVGGLTEVARGLSMRRADVRSKKLVDYALRLGIGAVVRRLGYLMEAFDLGTPGEMARLRERLTPAYSLLDPVLPPEGKFLARWRLRLNVSPEEIQTVVRA